MCSKAIPGSGKKKYVVWTIDPPFKKGKPGFVARSTAGYDAEPTFTDDIWYAWVFTERKDMETMLAAWRRRTKASLYTHEAIASLTVPS